MHEYLANKKVEWELDFQSQPTRTKKMTLKPKRKLGYHLIRTWIMSASTYESLSFKRWRC